MKGKKETHHKLYIGLDIPPDSAVLDYTQYNLIPLSLNGKL